MKYLNKLMSKRGGKNINCWLHYIVTTKEWKIDANNKIYLKHCNDDLYSL